MPGFDCVKCGKVFTRKDNAARHKKTAHPKKKLIKTNFHNTYFECSECGNKFSRKDALKRHVFHVHAGIKFECHHCVTIFKYKSSIIRHLQTKHSNNKQFKCRTCNESFSQSGPLNRHRASMHNASITKKIDCVECGKVFSHKGNLARHTNTAHPKKQFSKSNFFQNTNLECSECGIKFSRKDALKRHIFHVHAGIKFECHQCGAKFKYKRSIIVHLRAKHSNNKQFHNGKMKTCALCEYSSTSRIQHHYQVHHQVHLVEKQLNFNNYDEFLAWKIDIEDSSNSRFVVSSRSKGKSHKVIVFSCHRSGVSRIKSIDRKRRLKLKGSMKINSICPAEIRIRCNIINDTCVVSFCDTHLGHDLTSRRHVGSLNMHEEDRALLAGKIAAGVSLNRILDDNQYDVVFENYLLPNLKRSDLLHNRDLHNIKKSYNVKPNDNEPRPFSNDAQNLESFVKRYERFILYYKKEHEEPPDNRFPALQKEDILLIFMCPAQKLLLQKHGHNVIAMDGSHGPNPYDFILQTILILDYDGEGYPVAFAMSNCIDVIVIDVFLSCVKAEVGIIQPKTLMTDMQMTYFNSWQKIMMTPQYHLFCMWYVFEAWRKNTWKIRHKEKRKIMLTTLYELVCETDVDTFTMYLNELLNSADDNTAEFLDYFRAEYGNNVKHWAYCYRLDAGLNTKMHLEAFHVSLKYLHGKGKKINDLYTGLELIRNYLHQKLSSIRIKYTRGYITQKLRLLRNAHDKASKFIAENNKIQIEKYEDGWSVESFQKSDDLIREVYFIQRVCEKCPAIEDEDYRECNLECCECGVCAHIYRCTCIENTIKNHMCKHIHIALIISNETEDTHTTLLNTNIHIMETEDASTTLPNTNVHTMETENASTTLPNINVHTQESEDASTTLPNINVHTQETEDASTTCLTSQSKITQIMQLKKKLKNKLASDLDSATTLEQLKAVENLLRPILPTILSVSTTPSPSLTKGVKDGTKKKGKEIEKQKRIFTSTKKKRLKKQSII